MENVLKKIFSGEIDESVHEEFVKFGRGVFENRYLVEGKKQKDNWVIKTSAEFVNFFVKRCLEKISGSTKIQGAIICTSNIKDEAKFEIERVKQFQGVKQFLINSEIESSVILELMGKHPNAFYALSFSTDDCVLKVKAKAPKSGKPGSKGEAQPKADFCSLKTSDAELVKDVFFDFPEFKEIKMRHVIEINEVIFPEGVQDPVQIRALAKKKGRVVRIVNVDGKEERKEKEFEA